MKYDKMSLREAFEHVNAIRKGKCYRLSKLDLPQIHSSEKKLKTSIFLNFSF